MNEMTPEEQRLIERADAFAKSIAPQNIVDIMTMDGVAPLSAGMFSGGKALIWIAEYGPEAALRLAFCLGAAWERELQEGGSPELKHLLDDVNLD